MPLGPLLSRGLSLLKGPVARGSITSLAVRLAGIVLLLVQAVMAARLLGPTGYGIVALVVAIAQIAGIIALFGYQSHSVRKIAFDLPHGRTLEIRRYAVRAAGVVLALSAVTGLVISAIHFAMPKLFELNSSAFVLLLALVPLLALVQLLKGVNQGLGNILMSQVPHEVIRPAVLIAALVGFVAVGWALDPRDFLICLVAAYGFALASAIWTTMRAMQKLGKAQKVVPGSEYSADAEPPPPPRSFLLLSLVTVLQMEFATLLLSVLSTAEQTGLYQPIARILPLLALLITAALIPFVPRITQLWSLGKMPEVIRLTRTFTLATTALSLVCALGLSLVAPFVFLIFGSEFAAVAHLVWIIAAAQVLRAMCGPVADLLVTAGQMRQVLVAHAVALIAAASIAYVLIPEHGVGGAAIAVAANIVIWNLLMLITVRKNLGFDPSIFGALSALTSKQEAPA